MLRLGSCLRLAVPLLAVSATISAQQRDLPKAVPGIAAQAWPPSVKATDDFKRDDRGAPLRVRLLPLPRKAYRRLEHVPFEVSIENISKTTIMLPWSPGQITFVDGRTPTDYRHVLFDFVLTRRGMPDWRLARLELSGDDKKIDFVRLKTLAPGERVVIPAPLILLPGQDQDRDDPIVHPASGRVKLGVGFDAPGDPLTRTFGARWADGTVPFEIAPTVAAVPATAPTRQPPTILRVQPAVASQGMAIRLDGYRLGADRIRQETNGPRAHYFLSNGSTRVAVDIRGQAATSLGDPNTATQVVNLGIPDNLPPGVWNVIVELDGVEGIGPVPVSVAEWLAPRPDRLSIERVNPGAVITITGAYFRPFDEVVGFDEQGKVEFLEGLNGGPTTRPFVVSPNASEGKHTVRMQAFKPGARVSTRSETTLRYVVQHAPLAPVIRSQTSSAIGGGQWMVLDGTRPFSWSDRTEIEFSQGTLREVTEPLTSKATRVRVPAGMMPGAVTVRARIWHEGAASDWSEPATYTIALAPVPPILTAIYVGVTQQRVPLGGPTPARRFDVVPGDKINLSGYWPISFTASIPVSLERRGQSIRLPTKWTNQSNVEFTVPDSLKDGPWTITTGATDGTPDFTLPAVMYVR